MNVFKIRNVYVRKRKLRKIKFMFTKYANKEKNINLRAHCRVDKVDIDRQLSTNELAEISI